MDSAELTEAPANGFLHADSGRQRLLLFGRVMPGLSLREAVLAGLCALLTVALIAVAAALGSVSASLNSSTKETPNLCLSQDCLDEAIFLLENMNLTQDPCTNFYDFVCGSFPEAHPQPDDSVDVTFRSLLQDHNDKIVRDMIEAPIGPSATRNSAEYKLKIFFQSCQDSYTLTQSGGQPMVEFLRGIGGYSGLGTFDSRKWDINNAMKTAHVQTYAPAFFTLKAEKDYLSGKERNLPTIADHPNGVELDDYANTGDNLVLPAYKKFIRATLTQLTEDGGLIFKEENVMDAIADILKVEEQLYKQRAILPFAHIHKLSELPQALGKSIDWLGLFKAFFGRKQIDGNSEVYVTSIRYAEDMGQIVGNLTERELNSYIGWVIIKQFIGDLGWQYTHFYREFLKVKQEGVVDFDELGDYCFRLAGKYMGDALDFAFIQTLRNRSTADVSAFSTALKSQLKVQLEGYTFFNESEKQMAKAKIDSTVDRFGYPKTGVLDSEKELNNRYNLLSVEEGAHFANLESLIEQKVRDVATTALTPANFTDWPDRIYSAQFYYSKQVGEMYFPSGALQRPVFDPRVPFYINYGSLGRFLGSETVKAIDLELGGTYYPNSTWGFWWGEQAINAFDSGPATCTRALYEGKPWDLEDGITAYNVSARVTAHRHMLHLGGLRAAHSKLMQRLGGGESIQPLPGQGLQSRSAEQAFFIAYGQSFCFDRTSKVALALAKDGKSPERLLLNTLMSQFKAFTDAFQCPSSAALAYKASRKCESY